MKVGNAIIQKRMIEQYDEDNFYATYKNYRIEITTEHGFDPPDDPYIKRFMIDVISERGDGMKAVDALEDCETIEEAIEHALWGADLI